MSLSSKYTKGIEIEIGGNATKLKTALYEANTAIKKTQTELTTLKNSLKLEWDEKTFTRAQELARQAMEETRKKAALLESALAELDNVKFLRFCVMPFGRPPARRRASFCASKFASNCPVIAPKTCSQKMPKAVGKYNEKAPGTVEVPGASFGGDYRI